MTFFKKQKQRQHKTINIWLARVSRFFYLPFLFTKVIFSPRFTWTHVSAGLTFDFMSNVVLNNEIPLVAWLVPTCNKTQHDSEYIKLHKQSKRKIFLSISPSEKHYIKFGCPKSKSSCQNSFARFISQMEHVMAAIWQS